MGEALSRLLQAIRFERDAFVWMDFNDRATGDAMLFVGVTRVLILLGAGGTILGLTTSTRGIEILFRALINAVIFWLAYAGLAYATVRFLFQKGGSYPVYLRMTGFAYPTLLLVIFTGRLGLAATAEFTLGSVWFLAIVTRGITYESDLPTDRAAIAAVLAFVGWIVLTAIMKRGLI